MSSGDLTISTPKYSEDEIGILSAELDKLRITLKDTLQQEQKSRQANQDLITAISLSLIHILHGYSAKDNHNSKLLSKSEAPLYILLPHQ